MYIKKVEIDAKGINKNPPKIKKNIIILSSIKAIVIEAANTK